MLCIIVIMDNILIYTHIIYSTRNTDRDTDTHTHTQFWYIALELITHAINIINLIFKIHTNAILIATHKHTQWRNK